MVMAWLLVMAILTWYFAGISERQRNPNTEVNTGTSDGRPQVILQRNRWGHYLASGEINGKPVTFMVDTGATHVAVPLHLHRELGLEQGMSVPINTANGRTTAYLTRIPELVLGGLRFYDVRGGLAPGMEGDEILLGMSVLADLTMIQEGDQLILRQ